MNEQDYKHKELIDVRLTREEFERLDKILAREEAMDWFTSTFKSWWVFALASGILTVWALWDKIKIGVS
jgi:hypothetical protein